MATSTVVPLAERQGRDQGRALLVHDDPRLASFLCDLLAADARMDVSAVADVAVAAFLAATDGFDVVLLGLGYPTADAQRALETIRAAAPTSPVVVLANDDAPGTRRAALDAGAAAYLPCPLVVRDVVGEVRRVSARHPAIREHAGVVSSTRPIWVLTDRRYQQQRMPTMLVQWLKARQHEVRIVVADGDAMPVSRLDAAAPARAGLWSELEPGDMVVTRSRHPYALALLAEAESRGARPLHTAAAIRAVRDKVATTLVLAELGVPVPPTFLAHRPADLVDLAAGNWPLLLKPYKGDNAAGIRRVETAADLDDVEWPDALVLAQPLVESDGVDLKLYTVAGRTWAVRVPSPLSGRSTQAVEVPITPDLEHLARSCGEPLGLELYGVDVLQTDRGPVVVDVNDFPNYRAIDDAVDAIGGLVERRSGRSSVASTAVS